MLRTEAERAQDELLMISANLQIARLFPKGHSLRESSLGLIAGALQYVPIRYRDKDWVQAHDYLEKNYPGWLKGFCCEQHQAARCCSVPDWSQFVTVLCSA